MKPCRRLSVVCAFLLFAAAINGAITAPLELKKLVEDSTYVVMAKVTTFDPQNKRMIVTLTDDLKGKAVFRRVPILLEGDNEGRRFNHPAMLIKRLTVELPLVMFILRKTQNNANIFITYVYTNGTWFELRGNNGSDQEAGVWALTHGEPYLRRTFCGPTEEMRKYLSDYLAGKGKLPRFNDKEKPGFGPEIPQEKS
jgi:hypothetical protein